MSSFAHRAIDRQNYAEYAFSEARKGNIPVSYPDWLKKNDNFLLIVIVGISLYFLLKK